ncbi:hypothetical protein HYT26_01425 [Candidatus Pacearchaeota archaeon]|nr:hypothetical protein [Candidatus Pacearchaeota archaeon]
MYKIGDTFITKDLDYTGKLMMYYVLVQVADFQIALIGLGTWNRWHESVNVKDIHAITYIEFKKISYGGKFKRCNKEEAFKCLLQACA